MKIVNNLSTFYQLLINDKKLLRLLYYLPKDDIDDPLDESKIEVSMLPEKDLIINNLLVIGDKTNDLTMDSSFCRICLYTGSRTPQKHYLNKTKQFIDNPYCSTQQYIFDIYTPNSINNVDFRLDWLGEALNEVLFHGEQGELNELRFHSGMPLLNMPNGFVGYRWTYILPSDQKARGYQK